MLLNSDEEQAMLSSRAEGNGRAACWRADWLRETCQRVLLPDAQRAANRS